MIKDKKFVIVKFLKDTSAFNLMIGRGVHLFASCATKARLRPFCISSTIKQYTNIANSKSIPSLFSCHHLPSKTCSGMLFNNNGSGRYYSTLPTSDNQPGQVPPNSTPPTLTQRLKGFLKQYGKLGLGVYLGISTISVSSLYLALRTGVDVKALIKSIGLPDSGIWDSAGTFAVAYAIHKILMPLRLFLTVALTTWISKKTRFGMRLTRNNSGHGNNNNDINNNNTNNRNIP